MATRRAREREAAQNTATAEILSEFLEYFTYSVIFMRKVYSSEVFEMESYCSVPVQVCTLPGAVSYVKKVRKTVHDLLSDRQLLNFSVLILDAETSRPLQRFTLDISYAKQFDLPTDPMLKDLEQSLREILTKLQLIGQKLEPPAAKNLTFKTQLRTSAQAMKLAQLKQKEDFGWNSRFPPKLPIEELIPVKTATNVLFKLEVRLEQ